MLLHTIILSILALTLATTQVSADTDHIPTRIRVDIGSNGAPALVFTPNTTEAQVGDIIDFHFIDENVVSSVLLGTVDQPCVPDNTSTAFFNSGAILGDPTGSNIFSIFVTTKDPQILYCGVAAHCKAGMVAIINPRDSQTLDDYALAAKSVKKSVAPPMMVGGTFTQGVDGGPVGGPGAPPARKRRQRNSI